MTLNSPLVVLKRLQLQHSRLPIRIQAYLIYLRIYLFIYLFIRLSVCLLFSPPKSKALNIVTYPHTSYPSYRL